MGQLHCPVPHGKLSSAANPMSLNSLPVSWHAVITNGLHCNHCKELAVVSSSSWGSQWACSISIFTVTASQRTIRNTLECSWLFTGSSASPSSTLHLRSRWACAAGEHDFGEAASWARLGPMMDLIRPVGKGLHSYGCASSPTQVNITVLPSLVFRNRKGLSRMTSNLHLWYLLQEDKEPFPYSPD